MKIFPSDIIPEIDVATCEQQNIESIELMERAASAVSYEIMSRFLPTRRIVVIAGPGNNGGDALAVARILFEQGYKNIEVFLFNVIGKLSHDCEKEKEKLLKYPGIDFTEIKTSFDPPKLSEGDILIDGLFGSGLSTPLTGGFISLARYVNESGAYVVSIDIPSGLFGEWNDNIMRRDIFHANLTLAFQIPRLSFFFPENEEVLGEIKLLDIDLDEKKIKELPYEYMFVEARTVRPFLKKRNKFSGKRDFGSTLIFSGSLGMAGAAIVAAKGCLRSGAGLVTIHSGASLMTVLQTSVPEAMFEPDRNENFISDMTVHHHHQAIALGPGIGTNDKTYLAIDKLFKTAKQPLVIDADALNCMALHPELISIIPSQSIITPHIGEFDRLFGEHKSHEERLKKAIDMAKFYNIIIVLKGHHTMTIRPTGKVYFNSTGNPAMATPGSGDVLTGIIAAFLSQGLRPEYAATIGVYIHGLAGDMAVEDTGEYGLLASDIIKYCGKAIQRVMDNDKIEARI